MSANSKNEPNSVIQKYSEWLKNREPSIDVWQSLTYFQKAGEDLKWFVKVESNKRDEFCVYFSNMVEVWSEELTFNDFETKLQALNPNLEGGDAKTFTKFVKELIVGRQSSTINTNFDEDECNMQIQYRTKFSGCPFRWEYNGCKCSAVEAKRHIVDPVLILLSQYQRRELDLIDQLTKKDREIEAYKTNGARLTRKNLETVKFHAETWSKSDEQSQDFLDLCRDFRNDRSHPFQDLRIRSLLAATETGMQFLDACQLDETDGVQNVESSAEAECSSEVGNVVVEELPTVRSPAKRSAPETVEEDKDDEPDTTTVTNEKRSMRKKKLLRL